MVREFKLVNEKGQEYSLMNIEKYCLLSEPEGLGYSYSTQFNQIGDMFVSSLRKIEQGQINGTVNFINYDNYMNFINFIESSKNLKFSYKIPLSNEIGKEYFKDVLIQSITKTQKQLNGILSETVVFDCLSLWYEQNETIFKIENYEDEMRYPFTWNSRYIDYNMRTILFNNKGHIEAPIQVEIDGFVQNPTISIYIDKKEYANIKIPITINEYEKLLYSSKTGDIYIQKQNADGTKTNLWKKQYIDITKQNIFKLPLGISEIRLTADDDVSNAKLTVFPQYKAV